MSALWQTDTNEQQQHGCDRNRGLQKSGPRFECLEKSRNSNQSDKSHQRDGRENRPTDPSTDQRIKT